MAKAPERQYLGWAEANNIEWKVHKEREGRLNWACRWEPFMAEHGNWICSGIKRAYRRPSYRAVDWAAWQKPKCPCEAPVCGECHTRKEVLFQPKWCQKCKPCQWPVTTSGEVGWLAQHPSCKLEIYGNGKYLQKPPLPGNQKKISVALANTIY